jgi:hypothetical protein
MHERVLGLVAESVASSSPCLRSQVIDRLARELALPGDEAKRALRDLLEERVVDPITVCRYRAEDGRVVMEAGLVRGANFPALHPSGA